MLLRFRCKDFLSPLVGSLVDSILVILLSLFEVVTVVRSKEIDDTIPEGIYVLK